MFLPGAMCPVFLGWVPAATHHCGSAWEEPGLRVGEIQSSRQSCHQPPCQERALPETSPQPASRLEFMVLRGSILRGAEMPIGS